MIIEVDGASICKPFLKDSDRGICLSSGNVNPICALPEFRRFPWYPFQDFYVTGDHIAQMVRAQGSGTLYRQTMPCRDTPCKYYAISDIDEIDIVTINDWLQYDEGIIWFEEGSIIISSYSDFVVLGLDDKLSCAAFGCTAESLFNDSQTVFTRTPRPADAEEFLAFARSTWPDRS